MAYRRDPGRLFLFALSTCLHCRAARNILDELRAPFDSLEVDLLPEPEQRKALAELAEYNPALTFPTLLAGSRVAAGPLSADLRRLALKTLADGARGPGPLGGAPEIPAPGDEGGAFQINKARYGYASCPSRLATGDPERDRPIICPCVFRDEDLAKYGRCYGHLYFSPQPAAGRAMAVPDRWLR